MENIIENIENQIESPSKGVTRLVKIAEFPNYMINTNAEIFRIKVILIPIAKMFTAGNSCTSQYLNLYRNSKMYRVTVKRLMNDSFGDLISGEGKYIIHKDGNPCNCALDNLYRSNRYKHH